MESHDRPRPERLRNIEVEEVALKKQYTNKNVETHYDVLVHDWDDKVEKGNINKVKRQIESSRCIVGYLRNDNLMTI